ncbi:hypothetical protein EV147_1053 [Cupriavidus agavae]|uniref:Uncharacterized protein n=1 Tax=Cupriavidus agavae TaxID=1001822 RepID=A0A4Q7S808_9BURK|nr:hypothetical protein EV147_1053 [Cupriavidus agavae]
MHRRRPLDLDAFLRRVRILLEVPEPARDGG